MDIAYQIGQYLQSSGFGTLGSNIFIGQIPADKDGIYITRLSGTLNMYDPIETTILDIYFKDTRSEYAVQRLESVKRHMHRMYMTDTADAHIYSMLVLGDIETIERDTEYAKIYKFTLQVIHRYTDLIS